MALMTEIKAEQNELKEKLKAIQDKMETKKN